MSNRGEGVLTPTVINVISKQVTVENRFASLGTILVIVPVFLSSVFIRSSAAWQPVWPILASALVLTTLLAFLFLTRRVNRFRLEAEVNSQGSFVESVKLADPRPSRTQGVPPNQLPDKKKLRYGKVRQLPNASDTTTYRESILVLFACLSPWAIDWLLTTLASRMSLTFPGEPNELLGLSSLATMLLTLAWTSTQPHRKRLVVFASIFLMIFCVVMTNGLSASGMVYLLSGIFSIMVLWWLMGDYWESLQHRCVSSTHTKEIHLRSKTIIIVVSLLCPVVAAGVYVSPITTSHAGLLSTSGGENRGDDRARSGIGDGDTLVAAEDNATSFGPIESDLFIEDRKPSLYDIMNELYGEPKKKVSSETAVSLDGVRTRMNHDRLAESQGTGREFTLVRQRPRQKTVRPEDRPLNALLHYKGPVPQRLSMQSYNTFDGTTWSQFSSNSSYDSQSPSLEHDRSGKPWIVFSNRLDNEKPKIDWTIALRWLLLESPRIPTPDQVSMLHIDRVDRTDFFNKSQDDILEMTDRERVPSFTLAILRGVKRPTRNIEPARYTVVPKDAPSVGTNLLIAYAKAWTKSARTDWEKVDCINTRLRTDFQLDNNLVYESSEGSPIDQFLELKRGPSYLFASTSVLMLRELGIESRIANGFYVDARHYDRESSHYSVTSANMHWWPQIRLENGKWIGLECSPGYDEPGERLTMYECLLLWMKAWIHWIAAHPWIPFLFSIGLGCTLVFRLQVLDKVSTWIYQCMGCFSAIDRLRWGVWLLDQRARWASKARPKHLTHARWFPQLVVVECQQFAPLDAILRQYDCYLYSKSSVEKPVIDADSLKADFRHVLRVWSIKNLRKGSMPREDKGHR